MIILGKKSDNLFIVSGGAIGGLIGAGIDAVDRKRKGDKIKKIEGELKDLTLDEILGLNKESFAVRYDEVKEVCLLNPKSRWKSRELIVQTGEYSVHFAPSEEQFNQLIALLPNIMGLKGKTVFEYPRSNRRKVTGR